MGMDQQRDAFSASQICLRYVVGFSIQIYFPCLLVIFSLIFLAYLKDIGTLVFALAAGSNVTLLADQVKTFKQKLVAVINES
ncbi:hypothetical protein ACQ4PT_038983 [Festuca glaucescens]